MIRGVGASDSGGGYVSILVARDTIEYPAPGEPLVILTFDEHAVYEEAVALLRPLREALQAERLARAEPKDRA